MKNNEFLSLLKKRIFDFNTLLLKNGSYLGLDDGEINFLLNLYNLIDYNNTSFNKILSETKYSNKEIDNFLSTLIKNKFVSIKFIDKDKPFFKINFDTLGKKLLSTMVEPDETSSNDEKYDWISKYLKIELTDIQKDKINKWIEEEEGFEILKSIVFLSKDKKIELSDFKQLSDLYKFESKTKSDKKKKMREILKDNWLDKG